MATGVEMLGQMSEDINLAGPVQGGNMVVKPNEAPVGAAAMLAKQLRNQANKGVAGIYELPEPQDNIPEFMRIAQEGIERQAAGQRNMYPNNFADNEGGILRLPRNLRTAPGVPETSLAYITDEEKAILGLLKPGTPHRGPEDVPSYDSLDYVAAPSAPVQGATQSSYDTGQSSYSQSQGSYDPDKFKKQREREQQQETNPFANTGQSVDDIVSDVRTGVRDKDDKSEGNLLSKLSNKEKEKNEKKFEKQREAEKELREAEKSGDKNLITKAKTKLDKIIDSIKESTASLNIFGDSEQDKKDKKRIDELLKLAKGDKYNLSGSQRRELEKLQLKVAPLPGLAKGLITGVGAVGDMFSKPKTEQFMDDNYLNILESEILPGYGGTRDEAIAAFAKEYDDIIPGQAIGPGGQELGPEASLKMLLSNKGDIKEGSDLQKRLDSVNYYKDNQPQTSGGMEDMVQNLTFDKIKNSGLSKVEQRRLGARLMEAREVASRDRGGNQNNRPRFMQETQEEVVETPGGVIDEEAQTMKYTSPRTGDKEIDVPLSRRFRTDPTQDVAQYRTAPRTEADIYKYMTEGTTGEGIGLEPFSEYQRRRRKAMGLEPLGLYG
tara:strand:- start:706 stop:2526 length:1821 start_codon:yes stop_codon:yes gene_type:complete